MPPTATLEQIKAHQQKVEKDKITPNNLPPCLRCSLDSAKVLGWHDMLPFDPL
jgi:hypothetical protein